MIPRDKLKSKACQEIDNNAEEIIRVVKTILKIPELGFREIKTSKFVSEKFTELGITHRDGLARTGVKGTVNGGNEGPTVAVLGELDSLIVPTHPEADPETGAAHACGHNAQIGMIIGVAMGLTKSGILSSLSGRVAFIAVPAEEYIEIEFREGLRKEGEISYLGGKAELTKLGEFDDIDMAMITHTASTAVMRRRLIGVGGTSNGCLAKQIQFIGRGAHAGAAPYAGVNALNAAMIALSAIHTQRETFKDTDTVRVHPIITKGGEVVNIVPDDVRMETFVRGKTLDAIKDANEKVDRALRAGALAVGGSVKINTLPGYLPMVSDKNLQAVYRANAFSLVGKNKVAPSGRHGTGSTDMGDISHIMPAIHPYTAGASGTSHGNDYLIEDYNLAVLNPAKIMAMTVIDLLAEGAIKGQEVLKQHKAIMTKQEYLDLMESLRTEEEYSG
ncbi:MAG TPA: amidohydrolase [Dehalococcoidia bacterium]|nr:amidohydrolase [Dehalococcoidia bacterium]